MLWFWSDMYKRIALPHFFLSFQKALLIPQRSKKEGGWKEMARPQFAMIGMGVMGSALAKNFAEKGLLSLSMVSSSEVLAAGAGLAAPTGDGFAFQPDRR